MAITKYMRVLSLFDGISCGRLALERAGLLVECYDAFEIDKYAVTVSRRNYPDIIHHGDVFDGDFTKFKGYDLLLGGSPCTYWSIAKKGRETTSDGMGFKLFMEYVRALRESECKYFLYENNYSIHQNIKDEISNYLGVQPIMINSALVSGQNRKRCYWTNIPNVTQPDDLGIMLADALENAVPWQDKSYCMTTVQKDSLVCAPVRVGQYGKGGQGQRIYSVRGKSVTLSANGGGQGAKTGLYKIDLPDGDCIIHKLTPIEAERLQTLPDNYTAGISNTQRYKCIGNGWTVDVIAHILSFLPDGTR
jgi:DNA (cytosine-5)-methyltransferase 3A